MNLITNDELINSEFLPHFLYSSRTSDVSYYHYSHSYFYRNDLYSVPSAKRHSIIANILEIT